MKWEGVIKLIMPLLMALLVTYTGYGEYQKRQDVVPITNNFNLASPDVKDFITEKDLADHIQDGH